MTLTTQPPDEVAEPLMVVGRYAIFDEIAHGGFASIHVGRTFGAGGFARTVAIKRLHPQYAKDPEVSAMFLDEARVVARIRHPNVLPTLDLLDEEQELFLVMEYVEGVTLRFLMKEAVERKRRIPLGIALRIVCGALRGLHAAHEARDEQGEPLHVIHRDVSPENILVGVDGHPRLLDFGVARALGQYHSTRDGEVKGKMQYLTPEQVRGEIITRRTDIFSASVVLWEVMTGKSLFDARSIAGIAHALVNREIPRPSEVADTPKKLDGIVMQGLDRDPDARWATAEKMAQALEAIGDLASEEALTRYVQQAAHDKLRERARQVARVEAAPLPARPPMESADFVRVSAVPPSVREPGTVETQRADLAEVVASEQARAARTSVGQSVPDRASPREDDRNAPDALGLDAAPTSRANAGAARARPRRWVVAGAAAAALGGWWLWPADDPAAQPLAPAPPASANPSIDTSAPPPAPPEGSGARSRSLAADTDERPDAAEAADPGPDAAPASPASAAPPRLEAPAPAPPAVPPSPPVVRPAPAPKPAPPPKGPGGLYGRE